MLPSKECLELLIKIGYTHMDKERYISDKFSLFRP